jgi:serine/threonine protein kinase
MTPERYQRILELFEEASKRAPDDRATFLAKSCAGDEDLRRQVEAMLAADSRSGGFLEKPPDDLAAGVLAAQEHQPLIDLVNRRALTPGMQIGSYRIEALLGEGGMGKVHRAMDTRLKRAVAIKVAKENFGERFQREARVIAALNHPNICTLYDVGPDYLVMELIEGPTLAERIKQGPVPLEEALGIARQIADALEAAHEKGVVHRDLKPGNIKIKPDGIVKVLDFGLAKVAPVSTGDSSAEATATLTTRGMILGTAAYMSPEQARAQAVDKRTDIWAFGVVLYEMLTGKRLFKGEDVSETLAAVIKGEPQLDEIPARVRPLLRRCLEKDPKKRLRDIGDARITIEEVLSGASQESDAPVAASRSRWPWAAAAAMLVLAIVAGAAWFLKPKPEQPLLQMEITPPEGAKFVPGPMPFALSPDGRRIAFLATGKDGEQKLWLRSIDSSSVNALAGTENANAPFWSPDSRWVGFSTNGGLGKVDVVGGGQPQGICDIEGISTGTWNSDGVIVFGQNGKPLQRVSAAGGTPAPILSFDASRQETFQGFPYFLPDGRHFLYYSKGRKGDNTMLASLDGKLNRSLIAGPDADVTIYAPNPRGGGSILYNGGDQLVARPFDLDKLEFTGPPAVIADAVGERQWSASADGLLAFRHNPVDSNQQLTWVSRDGHSMSTVGDPGLGGAPRISPDQKTFVFARQGHIWTFDLTRNTSTRFAFVESLNVWPIWSSDGKSIVSGSNRNNAWVLVERPANGIGPETIFASQAAFDVPTDVSHDGRWLVATEYGSLRSIIALRSREDPSKIIRIQERGTEQDGAISPDGRWLLYSSIPATRREILVQSVPKEAGGSPNGVGKWQISTAGGGQPAWRGDGKEIFYVAPDGMMMAVPVESGENFFRQGAPKPLFQTRLKPDSRWARQYDVTTDGQRFLLSQPLPDNAAPPISVIVNWPKLLQK